MKSAVVLILSILLVVQGYCATSVTTKHEQRNITEALKLLEDGYVRIWVNVTKSYYKSEMACELAQRKTWSHGVEKYLDEFRTDLEGEIILLMEDVVKNSCSAFRSDVREEMLAMMTV